MAEKRVDFTYNEIGQFATIARYKDTDGGSTHEVATSTYSRDTLGRLTGLVYKKGGNNLFTAYSWTYDNINRVTQFVSQDGTNNYSYDANGQLTSASLTSESYSYDANGNRTNSGYQTGDNNRLTNDGTYSYAHDNEGNRTSRTKTSTGEVTEYEWDYHNRLTKVTEKDSQGAVTRSMRWLLFHGFLRGASMCLKPGLQGKTS